jgi:CHAT domain-containing protein
VTTGPSEGVPTRDGHPDAASIAAHVERRLTSVEAARVEEHLAGCSTCYELFAETVRFQLEEEADEDVASTVVVRPWRRPAARLAAALALAAGLALASWPLWHAVLRPAAPPLLADLVRSVGDQRLIEPRLTGGFRYARFVRLRSGDAPQGLDAQPPAVIAAVARIRERAETDTSPEALSALGITYLVSGDASAAVKALESAAAQAPQDPRIQSDLAAAYLTRASRLDEPVDLPRALEAAEKAVALPGAPEEAWFNRALALEDLQLADEARKAWNDYLERDPSSAWAEEARRRLAEIKTLGRSSVEEDHARVREALADGAARLERLTGEEPAIVRAYFDEELLPAWAEARLAPAGDARPLAEQAALVGGALWRRTGDALPRDAAAALQSTVALAGRDPPRAQALGYRLLAEARRRDETQRPACETFREAQRLLSQGGSPYAAVAAERTVSRCLYPSRLDAARAELARLATDAEPRGYLLLLARTRWLQGLIAVTQGELTGALERYRLARDGFVALGDATSQAFLDTAVAEALTLLGDGRQAWEERRSALALLDHVRDPRRVQGILEEAALACLDAQLPRAALALLTALVDSGVLSASPGLLSDALTRRSLVRLALGEGRLAVHDVSEARRQLPRIEDGALSDRMRAEVDAAEGALLASTHPERAAEALRRAADYFAGAGPVRVPPLRLQVARVQSARGLVDSAEEELLAGIRLIEAQRVSLHDLALQASFFEQAVPLYDDMVALQLDHRLDPAAALSFVERGRGRQLVDSLADAATREGRGKPAGPGTSFEPASLQREMPRGVALAYYVSLDRRLLAWLVTRDDLRFVEQPIPRHEIVRLVAAQQAALERRATLATVRRVGERLHDVLVRPLAPFPPSVRALAFVPDAALHSASFAALWDRAAGRYLAEGYVLGVSPSGRLLTRHSGDPALPASPHALVVGDPRVDSARWPGFPPLPAAEQEAAGVAALYTGSELLVGGAATKAAFLDALRRSDVVHYAGHATAVATDPARSRLLLAADAGDSGALDLHGLPWRDLRAALVVLAACRSAAGTVSRTEGAFSLGRPFLAAGVPNVVGSLWDVDDDVSRTFFVAFHRSLLAGADPARALQSTQLSLLRSGDPTLAHPSTWAGFVSIGALRTPPR